MRIHVDLDEGQVGTINNGVVPNVNDTANETSCDMMDFVHYSSVSTAVGGVIDIFYAVMIYRKRGRPGIKIEYCVTFARFILEDFWQLII